MSELISGKEALIALANGEDVEWNCDKYSGINWHSIQTSPHTKIGAIEILKGEYGNDDVGYFDNVVFRVKPKTILIGDLEVPAPFDPKVDDGFWHISTENDGGYAWQHFENRVVDYQYVQFGAWRTEDEIKKVVAALRTTFKGVL